MTDEIKKPESDIPWGADVHFELARARDSGLSVDPDLERRVEADYLNSIRRRLQEDREAFRTAAEARPAAGAEEALSAMMSDLVREGSEDFFLRCLRYVLEELDHLREADPASYIVDQRTGKLVAALSERSIFLPEPYQDDSGNTVVPAPKLHPAMTAALAIRDAESNESRTVARLASDPVRGRAYLHLTQPHRMAESAREKLRRAGFHVSEDPPGEVVVLEFGREAAEADLQSTNEAFHRAEMYPSIVAIHVSRMCGEGGTCWIGEVERRRGGRDRWYAVPVSVGRAPELS